MKLPGSAVSDFQVPELRESPFLLMQPPVRELFFRAVPPDRSNHPCSTNPTQSGKLPAQLILGVTTADALETVKAG